MLGNPSRLKCLLLFVAAITSCRAFVSAPISAAARRQPTKTTRLLPSPHALPDLNRKNQAVKSAAPGWLERETGGLLKQFRATVSKVSALETEFEALANSELRQRANALRSKLSELPPDQEDEEANVVEAFALVREASWRVLRLRPYDVQLMGGLALAEGRLAEMATGEGKTLAAVAPTFLAALRGRGALVVTANDYLARRDAECVGQVHRFLGLSVGLVQSTMETGSAERREAYAADVTYVTNAELGFDYLRDNLALSQEAVVLRDERYFCLVDEADSLLIDEARTPLIISKSTEAAQEKYLAAKQIADLLRKGKDYKVDLKAQRVLLTDDGYNECEEVLQKPLFEPRDPWAPFIDNAVKAKELFQRDTHYLVRENGIAIVDSQTGRVMEGRRWSDGLYQSVEAKEGLSLSPESEPIAAITYQSLFREWPRLCGMTGTASSDALEFESVYSLQVTPIPTALPLARKDYEDAVFRTESAKVAAVVKEVKRTHAAGRPILVGTTSVADSEAILAELEGAGIKHAVALNARPEVAAIESRLIAQAGRLGSVTVATNMAGRGTDIVLGGNPTECAKVKLMEALVNDILGAGDIDGWVSVDSILYPCSLTPAGLAMLTEATGTVRSYFSQSDEATLEDLEEIVAIAAESTPVRDPTLLMARKAFDAVKSEFGAALEAERENVRSLGGLYVIGTERHESSRVDSQLRGRSGRQGDPGASRFFLSLEDRLFQLFGADRMAPIMKSFRIGDDIPIESKGVTQTLDQVQKQVEEYYSNIRASVLDFDEVLAEQRSAIYSRRRTILTNDEESLSSARLDWCLATANDVLQAELKKADGAILDASGLQTKMKQFFFTLPALDEDLLARASKAELKEYLDGAVAEACHSKNQNLEAAAGGLATQSWQYLVLVQTDNAWMAHLKSMKLLQQSIGLRSYQNLDVKEEYGREAKILFEGLVDNVRRDTVFSYFRYEGGTR